MCGGYNLFRNVLHQIFLGSQRCGAGFGNQPDAVAHPEHMRVYRHGSFVEHYALNDIGRLASTPGSLISSSSVPGTSL